MDNSSSSPREAVDNDMFIWDIILIDGFSLGENCDALLLNDREILVVTFLEETRIGNYLERTTNMLAEETTMVKARCRFWNQHKR